MYDRTIPIEGEVYFAKFINRPNRFLVNIIHENSNKLDSAFLHDPGRMKELLLPNVKLVIRRPIFKNDKRKTKWDVLAVLQNNSYIAINSSLPNLVVKHAMLKGWIKELGENGILKSEVKVNRNRLDFLFESDKEKCFIEVKGVTLVKDKVAMFPDAPTIRGVKHLKELIALHKKGNRAILLFICMRNDPISFSPNFETDPLFSS